MKCCYSVTASERGGSPFDIRIVDCGRPTVPCKCGRDSELCAEHSEGTCPECEYAEVIGGRDEICPASCPR